MSSNIKELYFTQYTILRLSTPFLRLHRNLWLDRVGLYCATTYSVMVWMMSRHVMNSSRTSKIVSPVPFIYARQPEQSQVVDSIFCEQQALFFLVYGRQMPLWLIFTQGKRTRSMLQMHLPFQNTFKTVYCFCEVKAWVVPNRFFVPNCSHKCISMRWLNRCQSRHGNQYQVMKAFTQSPLSVPWEMTKEISLWSSGQQMGITRSTCISLVWVNFGISTDSLHLHLSRIRFIRRTSIIAIETNRITTSKILDGPHGVKTIQTTTARGIILTNLQENGTHR